MRILSSVVIRVVLLSNSTCLVWVSTLFPRPGIAPDVELYQNLRKEALNNTRQIPSQNSHKPQQTPGQTSHMSPQTPIKQSHSKQTVTHNTIHTKQTTTHISTNTRPTVTHVTTNTNKTVTNPTVSSGTEEVTILKTVITNTFPRDKHELEGRLGHQEYGLIASPNG